MNTIRTGAALLLLSLFAVGGCDQRATTGSEIKDNAKQNMARAKLPAMFSRSAVPGKTEPSTGSLVNFPQPTSNLLW